MAVVVAVHSDESLKRCLAALQRDPAVTRVVLVDNGTASNLCEDAASCGITSVRPGKNVGFGRGCNLGATYLQDEPYVAFVNPDLVLNETLGLVVASACTGAAVLSARLATASGLAEQNARPMASPWRELLRALIGTRAYRSPEPVPAGQGRWVEQIAGSLLVIPATVWARLGGFDEQFELYYEDVDLCRRSQQLGGIWVVNKIVGSHEGGTSYRRNTREAFVAMGVSRLRYLRKWSGRIGTTVALVVAGIELVSRGIAGCDEGWSTRWCAFRAQWVEAGRPRSVWVLAGNPQQD